MATKNSETRQRWRAGTFAHAPTRISISAMVQAGKLNNLSDATTPELQDAALAAALEKLEELIPTSNCKLFTTGAYQKSSMTDSNELQKQIKFAYEVINTFGWRNPEAIKEKHALIQQAKTLIEPLDSSNSTTLSISR